MTAPRLKLPDVTICSADCAFVDLTARALAISTDLVEFGDAILFSDTLVTGPFRHVPIPTFANVTDYSHFCLRRLAEFIETPYALVVQWDGYVLNPDAWANAFRKYDYIGGAWHGLGFPPDRMVGNGGFSLRSKKLLKATASLPRGADHLEDRVICHIHRETLERQFGIRYAPVKIADRFAYEYEEPGDPLPFGFHGVYHLWRHVSDADLVDMIAAMEITRTNPRHILRLVLDCAAHGHARSAAALYARIRDKYPKDAVRTVLGDTYTGAEIDAKLALMEQMLPQ